MQREGAGQLIDLHVAVGARRATNLDSLEHHADAIARPAEQIHVGERRLQVGSRVCSNVHVARGTPARGGGLELLHVGQAETVVGRVLRELAAHVGDKVRDGLVQRVLGQRPRAHQRPWRAHAHVAVHKVGGHRVRADAIPRADVVACGEQGGAAGANSNAAALEPPVGCR